MGYCISRTLPNRLPRAYHAEWDIADAAALGSGNGTNGTSTTGWDNNVETFDSDLKLSSAGIVIVPMDCLAAKVLSATTGVVL